MSHHDVRPLGSGMDHAQQMAPGVLRGAFELGLMGIEAPEELATRLEAAMAKRFASQAAARVASMGAVLLGGR